VAGNGFVIDGNPVSFRGSTDSFKNIKRLSSSFHFVIAFLID